MLAIFFGMRRAMNENGGNGSEVGIVEEINMRKLIAVGLLLFFGVLGCGRENNTAVPEAVRTDARLLPAGVNALMYCDVQNVVHSALAQEVLQQVENRMREEMSHERYEEFKRATGFDPQRDVHSVLIGARHQRQHDENFYAIVHGQFDEQRMIAFIKQKMDSTRHEIRWQEETLAGHRIYINPRKGELALSFVSNNTIYAGNRDWLAEVLSGKNSGKLPGVFVALEKKIRFGDQAWMAVSLDTAMAVEPAFVHELRENFPKLESVKNAVFSAHVSDGVKFEGQLECKNAEDSKLMVDLMRGVLAAAKLRVAEDRAAVDALNSITVEQQSDKAQVHGELTSKFFDTLRARKLFVWGDPHAI